MQEFERSYSSAAVLCRFFDYTPKQKKALERYRPRAFQKAAPPGYAFLFALKTLTSLCSVSKLLSPPVDGWS